MRKLWLLVGGVVGLVLWSGSLAHAVTVGFEASEGYILAPLCPPGGPGQQGWSGGAQPGCTNNDPGDEEVVDTEAYAGTNSWHYARGYGSPGQGTPFSPVMSGVSGPGTRFEFSVHFKAASASGDGSSQNLYQGTAAGTDRTGFNLYLDNTTGTDGLTLSTYDWISGAWALQVLATEISRTQWHELEVVAVFDADPDNDVFEYSLDGTLLYTGNSWPNPWRVSMGFTPVYGNSIKFADGGGDDPTHAGFYYDNLAYDYSNIPEPGTALLLVGGLALLATKRRRAVR